MAFALAVGDLCAPAAVGAFAASSEPPLLGVVTSISPTVVLWQNGLQATYTPSTFPGSVDAGLSKFLPQLDSPFANAKVRPSGVIPLPNIDGRGEAIVVLAGIVTNANITDVEVVVMRFIKNGLYIAVPAVGVEIIPGA